MWNGFARVRRSGSLASLREANRRLVIDALRERGLASRADIARNTGLSRTTVSTIVADLLDRGLVAERDGPAGRGARARPPARPGLARPLGRASRSASTSATATCASRSPTSPTPSSPRRGASCDVDHSAAEGLDAAAELVDALARRGRARPRAACSASGMGLPGPDRHADRHASARRRSCPAGSASTPRAEMSERLGLPVAVDNDANLGALAEHVWGAGRGARDIVYLKVSTGIGAGLIARRPPPRTASAAPPARSATRSIDEQRPRLPLRQPRLPGDAGRGAGRSLELLQPTLGDRISRSSDVVALGLAGDPRLPARRSPTPGAAHRPRGGEPVQPAQPGAGRRRRRAERRRRRAARAAARGAARATRSRSAAEDVEIVAGTLGERAESARRGGARAQEADGSRTA